MNHSVKGSDSLSAVIVAMVKGDHISIEVVHHDGTVLGTLFLSDVRNAIQLGREGDTAASLLDHRPELVASHQLNRYSKVRCLRY